MHFSTHELLERLEGPMSLRLLFQPLMATLFAVRDGLGDAKNRRPPWLWSVFAEPEHRHELLRNGWKSVSKVFIAAIVLDLVYQLVSSKGHECHVLESLWVAAVLALVPYAMLRGITNRLAEAIGANTARWVIGAIVAVAAACAFIWIRSLKS
jgi:hypothetical protein